MNKRQALETEQKALEINLNDKIYGTFSEIGAGQEVARYFFQVGAAAGTIAKSMSAYDKVYSDKIYGVEASGRYVCESRIYKMLDHEYELMESRLSTERPETNFFVFADTVAAINYSRTIKGDGWLGLRFQLTPDGQTNEIILHVKMLDNDNQLQQQAVGILGVNLVYACYHYYKNPEVLLESLMDNLHGRVAIDMIRITGPEFESLDNRWLSLMLVKHKLTDVAMFRPDGESVHASEFLYKKNVMVVRGSFRPATLVNLDMLKCSWEQFRNDLGEEASRSFLLSEITMKDLCRDGELDAQDFLDRADILCALGQTVVVTSCQHHQEVVNYLSDYKVKKVGVVFGVHELLEMISDRYHKNEEGRLLSAFGELFTRHVKLYVYPALQEGSEVLMTCENLPVPEGVKFLYRHLLDSGQIIDVKGFNAAYLHIFSEEVHRMLKTDEPGWEEMVSPKIAKLIRERCLFGFPYQQKEFEY
ncbi:MAG: TonB-dependent receptor [Saprospiraceae bacterium]